MKIKKGLKLFYGLFVVMSLAIFQTCGSREDTVSCFPEQRISVQTNLNFANYRTDIATKGYTYINEHGAGTRGIILVKLGNRFFAFDRNAPHICPDTNTTLEVVGTTKIICPKDGAEWLIDGTPSKISNLPPKKYNVNYNPLTEDIQIYY